MKIAVCMMGITDSDARFLGACLDSLSGLHDELIFIDTQSSKQSLEPVRRAGGQIFVHPWADDYSLHRNQSLSYVSEDVEWVFLIDPDEKLFGNIPAFRAYLETLPASVNAVSIPLNDIQSGDTVLTFNSARCFRRGCVEYKYVKHNTPFITGESVICSGCIYLEHYGYGLSDEEMAAKDAKTERLLIKRLELDPKDYGTHFYLAQHYGGRAAQYDRAITHIETYIAKKNDIPGFNTSAYFTGYGLSMAAGDLEKAAGFLRSGLQIAPLDIDLNYGLVEFGEATGDTMAIYNGANAYLQAYDTYMKDTTAQAERFVFRADPSKYARCLYHVGIMSAQMARNMLKKLAEVCKQYPENKVFEGLMADASKNLGVLKVKIAGIK